MSYSEFDHQCMAEAMLLARRGLWTTHPNPRVGCVITQNRQVVGRGWHEKAGEAHAEVHALMEAGDKSVGGTAYVTLEPCGHMGRTKACVDALITAGVQRVVCAMEDPNPEVSGAGIERLQKAGIKVQSGLMSHEAEELNPGFLSRMRRGRPFVRIKLAQSIDGHIALSSGESQWISGPESRSDVQKWRARSDAILTGVGTVIADNPSLNVRMEACSRQPLRVIADSRWSTPADARIFGLSGKVMIAGLADASRPDALAEGSAEYLSLPARAGRLDLEVLLLELGKREINEVQVEAGATLCGALLQQGLVDELLIYQSPVLLGGGAVSPFAAPRLDKMVDRVHLEWIDSRRVGKDLRLRLKPVYKEG